MRTEMDVSGELLQSFSSTYLPGTRLCGWIELVGKSSSDDFRGDIFFVYFSLLPGFLPVWFDSHVPSLRRGAMVVVYNVLPVYLWGRLHGFVATSRSQVALKEFPSVIPSRKSNENKAVMSSNTLKRFVQTTRSEFMCFQFEAWSTYVARRLGHAFRKHIRGDPVDTNKILGWLLSLARCNYISIPRISLRRCIQRASALHTTMNESYAQTSYVHPLKVNCDKAFASLILVRGGMDADYLCSLLPEVIDTVSSHNIDIKFNQSYCADLDSDNAPSIWGEFNYLFQAKTTEDGEYEIKREFFFTCEFSMPNIKEANARYIHSVRMSIFLPSKRKSL